jgi:hypothetical protein
MHGGRDFYPGDLAPVAGVYRLHNVFGSATDQVVTVTDGDQLPAAPLGHTWRPVRQD